MDETKEYTINDLVKMITENQAKQDLAHAASAAKMSILEAKIDPVYEVYSDLQGTKRVLRSIIVTATLIIGFFVSIGELFRIYHNNHK